MQQPIATWNPARGVWETNQTSLLCEHSALFSASFPTSGMTHDGRAYELPTPELRTAGSACSSSPGLLKTPTAALANLTGTQHPDKRRAGGHGPTLADEVVHLLPTPLTSDDRYAAPGDGRRNSLQLRAIDMLLPTPAAHESGNTPQDHLKWKPGRQQVTSLQVLVTGDLVKTGGRMPQQSPGGSTSRAELPLPLG